MYAHALEGQRLWHALEYGPYSDGTRSGSIWQPALMPRKVHRRGLVSQGLAPMLSIRTTSAPKFRV